MVFSSIIVFTGRLTTKRAPPGTARAKGCPASAASTVAGAHVEGRQKVVKVNAT